MLFNILIRKFKLLIFFILFLNSCSTMIMENNIKYNKNSVLQSIASIDQSFNQLESLLYVDIDNQNMFFLKKGTVFKVYKISSSYYGTGSEANSLKTPLGKHEIYRKLGQNLPVNAILKGRVWNGAIANIITEEVDTDFDHVTSRILWLDGLEVGKNKGKGIDSFKRYIYIHGTSEEGRIGIPSSHGFIRMRNIYVIDLYKEVKVGTLVLIF